MSRFDLSQIPNGSFRSQHACLELFINLHFSFFLVSILGKVVGGQSKAEWPFVFWDLGSKRPTHLPPSLLTCISPSLLLASYLPTYLPTSLLPLSLLPTYLSVTPQNMLLVTQSNCCVSLFLRYIYILKYIDQADNNSTHVNIDIILITVLHRNFTCFICFVYNSHQAAD